jgi:starch-binding outer membrane protein, SusD/RagB family
MMNIYFRKTYTFLALVLGVLLASCTDYLDKSPLSDISSETAYKNFTNFQGFTEELYSCIPVVSASDYHNTWNWGEEEYWNPSETRLMTYYIDQGNYWGWNTAGYSWLRTAGDADYTYSTDRFDKGRLWGLSWYGIRKANIGLANLDKLTDATDEQKDFIAGQLYFFRGWFHFMLMQFWGGIPYVNTVLASDESPRLPRLSYQAVADSVAADFQKAADLLPVNWDETSTGATTRGNNEQRINKIMALTYLGKDLLWAGSPLMNNVSTGSPTYNIDYCKKSADAFAQALKLCDDTKYCELIPFSNYSQIFYTYNQSYKLPGKATINGHVYREAIFQENLSGLEGRWRYNQVNDYRPPLIKSTGIKVFPTANYIDYYGMANGLPIPDITKADPESGYDPEYPWRNRDPRFYNDIIFDGLKCVLASSKVSNDSLRIFASLFSDETRGTSSGKYRQSISPGGNQQNACFTGYMLKKFTSQYNNDWDGYLDNYALVLSFMRLADVYLMYAEAVAQGYGSPASMATGYSLSAVDAVNKVRERAGVLPVASKFLGSSDDFMSELRRERAVELAFEGHRFTDLRRWMLLLNKPYTLKKAVYFDRDPNIANKTLYADPNNAHVLNLREGVLFERQLGQKHYWFPFLTNDVNIYEGFNQNPGW